MSNLGRLYTFEKNMLATNTLAYYITAKQGFIVQATGGSPFFTWSKRKIVSHGKKSKKTIKSLYR